MSSAAALLRGHREILAAIGDRDFIEAHDTFLRALAAVDDVALDRLDSAEEADHRIFFSQCQRRYLATLEKQANISMRASVSVARTSDATSLMDDFGRASYERVRDLERLADLDACHEVVMVGCGAFPATLLWLSRNFPQAEYVGIDVDVTCVEAAEQLMRAIGLRNVRFQLGDGSRYDYARADFVYVANHVTPKKAVLAQIVRSNPSCQIVVREPTRRGALLSEAVRGDLPPNCVAAEAGGESSRFLSYDMVVQRTSAAADLPLDRSSC